MWGYHSSNRGRGRRTFVLPHVWHGDRDWIGEIYNNWNTLCSILLDVLTDYLPTKTTVTSGLLRNLSQRVVQFVGIGQGYGMDSTALG